MECNCLCQNEERKLIAVGIIEVSCQGCGKHLYDETDQEAADYEASCLADEITEVELDLSYAISENKGYSDVARLVERLGDLKRRYKEMTST
jgi:hypothetical protein